MAKIETPPKQKFVLDPVKFNALLDRLVDPEHPLQGTEMSGFGDMLHGWADIELSAAEAYDKQVETIATFENHKNVVKEEGQ